MPFWERFRGTSQPEEQGLILIPLPRSAPPLSKDVLTLSSRDYEQLILFWKEHFGTPPKTPTLLVNPKWLAADATTGNLAFRLRGWKGVVYGRRIGDLLYDKQSMKTFLIEGLCLKPEERQKGLTPLLLDACVRHLCEAMPYTRFIFLKEGRSAPTDVLASDTYMYRRLRSQDKLPGKPLTAPAAKELFATLTAGSSTPWLTNEFGLPNSRTSFYGNSKAMIAVTETHQVHHLDGRRLGLITGYITAPDAPPEAQEDLLKRQPYSWIWSPSSYVSDPSLWLQDGYVSYQPFLFTVQPQIRMSNIFLAL